MIVGLIVIWILVIGRKDTNMYGGSFIIIVLLKRSSWRSDRRACRTSSTCDRPGIFGRDSEQERTGFSQ